METGVRLWKTSKEMCEILGVCRDTLDKKRRSGLLKEGRHWTRKTPGALKSTVMYHQQRVEMALNRV